MRISTGQIYQQGLLSMQNRQAELQRTELQLGSGLRIMKPSDDPSGAVKVLNLNANIDVLDQFDRNVAVSESALSFSESVIDKATTVIQRVRELAIQGNNSTTSAADRTSIANEIYTRLDELVGLANTRDANGEYIFGGNRTGSPPFVNSGGNVAYVGDQGERRIMVGENTPVTIRDSGDRLFQSIPGGDGRVQVSLDPANTGTLLVEDYGVYGAYNKQPATINFIAGSPMTYNVVDNATPPNIVSSGTYAAGTSIDVGGAQVTFSGTPAAGDSVTVGPAQNQSLFTTVKQIADTLATPANGASGNARFHNDMAAGIAGLDQGLNRANDVRAGIGARLNNVQSINEINQDFKLQLETVLSDTQDLDYAEAITRFNQQLTALQAAQQAFVKTSGLSLFQYL